MSNPKAFPTYEWVQYHGQMMAVGGMDLRDYFAAKLVQGLICRSGRRFELSDIKDCYKIADEMMKARELCSDTK